MRFNIFLKKNEIITFQIIFSYSDYFSETSNHCLHLNNYNNLQLIRNISWFGCIGFAFLIDKGLSFKLII